MKYVKLRPTHQAVIKIAFNSSLIEILKITQQPSIIGNDLDNLFRCRKTFKFSDGSKANIQKIVPNGHNLYSFLAHVLSDMDLNEPISQNKIKCIYSSVELVKKAVLLDFKKSNVPLLHKLEEVSKISTS